MTRCRTPYIYIIGVACLFLLAACSTTDKLPDDEQLYIGIKKVSYTDAPSRRTSVRRDSVGVITTISDVAHAVNDALSGKNNAELLTKLKDDALGTTADDNSREAARTVGKEAAQAQAIQLSAFGIAQDEVEAVLDYPPNNSLFGSSYYRSPIQTGLWFYNGFVRSKSKIGKWIFKTFAREPIYISTVSPDLRAKVAQNTLQNYGFFHGKVDYNIVTQKNPKKAKVNYDVHVGPLSRFDSISYRAYTTLQDSLLQASSNKRLLKRGDAFSVVNLANEQSRIGTLFRENGFFYWQDAYTTYQADTVMRPGYVQLRVQPSPGVGDAAKRPWYMGHTYISVRKPDATRLSETRRMRTYTFRFSGKKLPLRFGLWRHAIMHRKGDIYTYTDQRNTIEKLNNLGVFSLMDVSYVPQDTTATCDTLDLYVTAVLDKPYDSDFEMNATLKSNQQVGPGLSYSLNKRNAFRGGETVSLKFFGSYEWQLKSDKNASMNDSYELGTQLALKFPRFVLPFTDQSARRPQPGKRRRMRFPAETTIAASFDWKRRAGFFTMVTSGLSLTYNWHKQSNSLHEFTPLSLDYTRTIHTTRRFDSIMTNNPALLVSMQDQFIPSMSYTYSWSIQRPHPLMLQFHAKQAGNLTSAAYAATGRKFSEPGKNLFGSPFAQFVKGTAELRYSHPLAKRFTLATRFFGGVIYSYGNSQEAPYAERFYVGGANSVRGFMVRSIGPGRYHEPYSKYSYLLQTGDVKLEANAELRSKLFSSLYGAVFLDAGNVWLLRKNELMPDAQLTLSTLKDLAVGTGAGLRYDLDFLVLRFDLGIGLHAPYRTGKSGFYNLRKFSDGLNFHFAIGYPF